METAMGEQLIFRPELSEEHCGVDEKQLIAYNPDLQLSYLRTSDPEIARLENRTGTVIIRISSYCEGEGNHAKASWGVYFGPGSQYNEKGSTQAGQSAAETDALWHTINRIDRLCVSNNCLGRFVIATDSQYLGLAMSFWGPNNGKSRDGRPVPTARSFMPLYERLYSYNFVDCRDINIKLWVAPTEKIDEAHQLAKQALNRRGGRSA